MSAKFFGTSPTVSRKPATWLVQRTFMYGALLGAALLTILAIVLAGQESRLPDVIWDYTPAGRSSPATLGQWSPADAFTLLWGGVIFYLVAMVILTVVWWALRATQSRAAVTSPFAVIVSITGFIVVNVSAANLIPQVFAVPETRAEALSELSKDSFLSGLAFVALAILSIGAGHLLARRFSWPEPASVAGTKSADASPGPTII